MDGDNNMSGILQNTSASSYEVFFYISQGLD
jgi:hypothetical protein